MLRPRIIPCLLVHNGGLVKTVQFANPKYVGDPLNAVRIFNEMQVDELMVLDIDATRAGRPPDMAMIADLAAECRMPLCYGGGVTKVDQLEQIIASGVEKIALGTVAVADPNLVANAAARVGSQSIVVVVDVATHGLMRRAEVVIRNGTTRTGRAPIEFARALEKLGAGEIVLNSVDRDGKMAGYDLDLVDKLKAEIGIPLTVLGGAGSLDDIRELVRRHPTIGAAAGSLFVFKGKFRAVLINYPGVADRDSLLLTR